MSQDSKPNYVTALANDLVTGISSDIWFDPQVGEEAHANRIELTQNAMQEAAAILPALVNDLAGALVALARLREGRTLSADDEAAELALIESAQARVETMQSEYDPGDVDLVQPRF